MLKYLRSQQDELYKVSTSKLSEKSIHRLNFVSGLDGFQFVEN
jgi:hypothetical protein